MLYHSTILKSKKAIAIPHPTNNHECLDRYRRAFVLELRSSLLVEGICPDLHQDYCNCPRCHGYLHIRHDSIETSLATLFPITRDREHLDALFGLCRIWYGRHGRKLGISWI